MPCKKTTTTKKKKTRSRGLQEVLISKEERRENLDFNCISITAFGGVLLVSHEVLDVTH